MIAMVMAVVAAQAVPVTELASETGWTKIQTAPATFGSGAALAALGEYVYFTPGGGSIEFWAYAPATDEWLQCADLPATCGAMTAASDCLYALAGVNLCKYIVSENKWVDEGSLPQAPGAGACLENTIMGDVYYVPGGSTPGFWRRVAGAWQKLALPYKAGMGTRMARINDNFHFLRGLNSDDRYFFNVPSGLWIPRTPLPETVSGGSAIVAVDNHLYAFRGASSIVTYRIDTLGDVVTPWLDAPELCKTGTAMALLDGVIYAGFGQGSAFYRIIIERRAAVLGVAGPEIGDGASHKQCGGSAGGAASWLLSMPVLLVLALRPVKRPYIA